MSEPGSVQYLYDMRAEVVEANPCEDVEAFAARMVARAWDGQCTVLGEFNQHTLEARPGMTRAQVMKPWSDATQASYFGGDR